MSICFDAKLGEVGSEGERIGVSSPHRLFRHTPILDLEMSEIVAHPASGKRPHQTAYIDRLAINISSREHVLKEVERVIEARETGHFIAVTNPESMFLGQRISSIRGYMNNADFSVCDGVGVIVAGWAWGHLVPRLPGPTLQLLCHEWGVSRGWRHFYYGGKAGVADEMARRLKEKFPGLIVCGTYCPPFGELSPEEDSHIVDIIDEAKPDIVWVGLGLPKQERWIAAHQDRLAVPWLIGVGGAFDYHSGAIPWAPQWIRAIGMEWLFRLIIEPKMRLKRTWRHLIYVSQTSLKGLLTLRFLRACRSAVKQA